LAIGNTKKRGEENIKSRKKNTESREKNTESRKKNTKSREKILNIIKSNAFITQNEIVAATGLSVKGIEKISEI
jgi:hypothetical protein